MHLLMFINKAIYVHFLFKPPVILYLQPMNHRLEMVYLVYLWYIPTGHQTNDSASQNDENEQKSVYTYPCSLFLSWCSNAWKHQARVGTIFWGISVLLSRINTACVGYHIFIIKVSLSCLMKFPRENNRNVIGYMLHVEETLQNLAQPCFDCCLHGWLSFKFTHLTFSYFRWITNLYFVIEKQPNIISVRLDVR